VPACSDCNKILNSYHKKTIRCRDCFLKFVKTHIKIKKCLGCNKILSNRDNAIRCRPCNDIYNRTPFEKRFFEKVKKTDKCWIWTGSKLHGYGQIYNRITNRPEGAHRVSWEIHNGLIKKGLHILHRCDNPPCVNPEHLFIGTNAENVADAIKKGRNAKGSQCTRAKLNEKIVTEMKKMFKNGSTYKEVTNKFGFNHHTVYSAIKGITWRHVI